MTRSRVQDWSVALCCAVLGFTAVNGARGANPDHVAAFKKTLQCPDCDLTHAALAGMQAPNAQLQNADLSDANFYGGSLRGADLTGTILNRTNLEMVDLTGAIGAILEPAKTDSRTTCPDGHAGPCS